MLADNTISTTANKKSNGNFFGNVKHLFIPYATDEVKEENVNI